MMIHEYFLNNSKSVRRVCLSKILFSKDEKWKRTFFLQNFLKALMKYDG